ncbi:DUF4256 domain-containing protein [Lysinibacillus sp. 2017]|uniref:DUF4256 domain-containing protein n=1 Tax=unclassified Lysinibacillus TaxID=2636778 RepID=UPI000D529739|nr:MULTISPECIES: DUF4256 domain-containing protein [unclassified Lysinibacillus]AWE08780.1 DUF4256 domain-containing protein [Lysinibacillus sp. 2017]TGN36103.1 DUF4256 domain-containing protein [Lysinibacillus sp. S2017]
MLKSKTVTEEQLAQLLQTLKQRFEKNMNRHEGIQWEQVLEKLEECPEKLWSLQQMEETEGEPDVIGVDANTGGYLFMDCSAESPKGRRSICYDREALDARKNNKPATSAMDVVKEMGIELATEAQYRALQELGEFDLKTSSWIATPDNIRKLGGALFCDRRYDTVFVYHNGADSYYGARGFRGVFVLN